MQGNSRRANQKEPKDDIMIYQPKKTTTDKPKEADSKQTERPKE